VLFLDSADDNAAWVTTAIVRGVTTNSTILTKAGESSVSTAVKRLLAGEPGELHVQVTSEQDDEAFDQARTLARTDPRIRVKIPFVTSDGRYREA